MSLTQESRFVAQAARAFTQKELYSSAVGRQSDAAGTIPLTQDKRLRNAN